MDISPYYIDARNAITQPDKMVYLSQYFRRSWMPALGPLGTAIVIYLRGACYHNRKSGEVRDTVQIAQREIATGCGCSVPTIKRELERNVALRRFVQISPEWERDGAGRVRQLENHYKVAMDDPLTEADEARLQEMVEERIRQEQSVSQGSGERMRKPIRRKEAGLDGENGLTAGSKAVLTSVRDAVSHECSNAVNTASSTQNLVQEQGDLFSDNKREGQKTGLPNRSRAPGDQFELLRPGDQFESTPYQNELLYKTSLPKTTQEQTLNVTGGSSFAVENQQEAARDYRRGEPSNALEQLRSAEVDQIVQELGDWGSERRHRQLLSICEKHNLLHLSKQALQATKRRLTKTAKHGLLEKPGAYYQHILVSLLEEHQVFVPSASECAEDDPSEVRSLIRESLGINDGKTH